MSDEAEDLERNRAAMHPGERALSIKVEELSAHLEKDLPSGVKYAVVVITPDTEVHLTTNDPRLGDFLAAAISPEVRRIGRKDV